MAPKKISSAYPRDLNASTVHIQRQIDELRCVLSKAGPNRIEAEIQNEYKLCKRRQKNENELIKQIKTSYVNNIQKLACYYQRKILDITEQHRLEKRRLESLSEKIERGESVDKLEYEKLKKANARMETRIKELNDKIDTLEIENATLQKSVKTLKREKTNIHLDWKESQRELIEYKDDVEFKSEELKQLKKQIDTVKRQVQDKEKKFTDCESNNLSLEQKLKNLKIDLEKMRRSRDEIEKSSYEKDMLVNEQKSKLSTATMVLKSLERENDENSKRISELRKKSQILSVKSKDIENELEEEKRCGAKYRQIILEQREEIQNNHALLDVKDTELKDMKVYLGEHNALVEKVENIGCKRSRRSTSTPYSMNACSPKRCEIYVDITL